MQESARKRKRFSVKCATPCEKLRDTVSAKNLAGRKTLPAAKEGKNRKSEEYDGDERQRFARMGKGICGIFEPARDRFVALSGQVCRRAAGNHEKKGELAEWILNIATGKTAPVEKSRRGAPVKEDFVDPVILEKLEELNFSRAAIEAEYTEEDSSERGGDILPEEKNKEGDFLLRSSGERKEAYYEKRCTAAN